MKPKSIVRNTTVLSGCSVLLAVLGMLVCTPLSAVEDDYEFMPLHAWRILGETGGEDATITLAEGFPGLDAEPGKDRWIEPVDGSGGFDNVASRLAVEEGPGGLEWDPSPTYRTRYKGGTDYPAGASQLQGNNWFTRMPYAQYDSGSDKWVVRFDANTFRVYDYYDVGVYVGKYGNTNSKLVATPQTGDPYQIDVNDIGGKVYTFESNYSWKCTKITGIGGVETTITYGSPITVLQKPSATSGSEVRKFTYTITSNRLDKIDVYEKNGANWDLYRKIDFTYFEEVTNAVEGSTGDLIGIDEETLLSPASTWLKRRWVLKNFTGTYNASTNPGYPYQVKAVLGPQSVRDFEVANPTTNIHTKTASELASYVDRTYKYESDKRLDELDLKAGCGCGGGEGIYTFNWAVNGTTPTDLNTWYRQVTITLPSVNGSSRIIDYNLYGQTLNHVAQEVAGNPSSRRWITTLRHDTTGRLTDSYSVDACTSYTDSSHTVTTSTSAGMRFLFAYDGNGALANVKLRDPANGNQNYQRKKAFSFLTSSDRRRFVKTSDAVYPTETTTDTGGKTTTFGYTYHASDALAVKLRTTTLPTILTTENGSGSAVALYDWFETSGLHTWTKDGDSAVHFTGFDSNRRTVTVRAINVDTDAADRPPEVPAPPDAAFNSSTGLNIVTNFTYDALRRVTKEEGPGFKDNSDTTIKTTRRWLYTRLLGHQAVVVGYPHVDTAFYNTALSISVFDHDGHVVTSALGELASAFRDTTLTDDVDTADSSIEVAFNGTILRRTESTYDGDKRTKGEVWNDADNPSATTKRTTDYTYDASGRMLTSKNPAGTITKYGYDVLNRRKSTKLGTVDGGAGDNMTLIGEVFYDDEEDSSSNVGDGTLTREKRYASQGGTARQTDHAYDYRTRLTTSWEPIVVKLTFTYDNLNRVLVSERWDNTYPLSPTRMSKGENFYDAWGQVFETREYEVPLATDKFSNVKTWRNARGLTIKTLSQGKVFQKTQYDGAGRVTNSSVSFDTAETYYTDADDLTGDTVIEETRYVLDKTGAQELVGHYQRRHSALSSDTGPLTVGSSGTGRAQYAASWGDKMHRQTHAVNYGTNGGTDLTARPTGTPPSSSSSSSLVSRSTYTLESEVEDSIDPIARTTRHEYLDPGELSKRIENYVDGTPGTDDDRTTEYTYDNQGRLWKITAKASGNDQITEHVYGVIRDTDNSLVSSNDLVYKTKLPDPDSTPPGQPSNDANDQEVFGYNALGELVWKKDQMGNEHVLDYDLRGRLEHDRVTAIHGSLDSTVLRISRTYDPLDRPVKVTSYNNATVGYGAVKNEVQYEYGAYSTISKIYQEWAGAVNVSTSKKVEFAYSFPTSGATGIRRTSTTHPDATVVTNEYNSGNDDTLSRLSGRKKGTDWLFQETYLGMGRLVERAYEGATTPEALWTLIGTDTPNNDNYVGLDRFGRIDDLVAKDGGTNINRYLYTYNYNSQISFREDEVGQVSGGYIFDETFYYDNLGRLTGHKRGKNLDKQGEGIELHECFTLDRSGNATTYYSGTATSCGSSWTATFNASNEYASGGPASTGYNDAGDLTTRGSYTLICDAWNRLMDIKSGPTTYVSRYKYNGLGQKIESIDSANNDTYYYHNDSYQVVEERRVGESSAWRWYAWGTQYIDDLAYEGPTTRYYVNDARFNTIALLDINGAVVNRLVYHGYGEPKLLSADWTTWQSFGNNCYSFTGRDWQKDHEQHDFRARLQDPDMMVFIRRDPIGIWGDEGNWGNGYAYVGNDPGNKNDPKGLAGEGIPEHMDALHCCALLMGVMNNSPDVYLDSPWLRRLRYRLLELRGCPFRVRCQTEPCILGGQEKRGSSTIVGSVPKFGGYPKSGWCDVCISTGPGTTCRQVYETMLHELSHCYDFCHGFLPVDRPGDCGQCVCSEIRAIVGSGECGEDGTQREATGYRQCVFNTASFTCVGGACTTMEEFVTEFERLFKTCSGRARGRNRRLPP